MVRALDISGNHILTDFLFIAQRNELVVLSESLSKPTLITEKYSLE